MLAKLLSWNVNGIRAIEKKGFGNWLAAERPWLLALQETKAHPDQLGESLKNQPGYSAYWAFAEKKGYSGVGVYASQQPLDVKTGFGVPKFDCEGRVLQLEYGALVLLNIYFPNGGASEERLKYKLDFYAAFLEYLHSLAEKGKPIIVCGDFNTAHREIDLARPKENAGVSGFLPEERAWLDRFIGWGLSDTFRVFNKEGGNYTWWDMKSRARERNVGWRLDYFMADKKALPSVKSAFILKDAQGSDHCPIGVTLEI